MGKKLLKSDTTEDDYTWISLFCGSSGNEFFCHVSKSYIEDSFNLAGLSEQIPHYHEALALILEFKCTQDKCIDQAAELLYGMIHARYILTEAGMKKMIDKYRSKNFGQCPRVYCENEPVMPIGLSDIPGDVMVKLYCPKCRDVYNPKSGTHNFTDGAYFGTGFPHMVFMTYPELRPEPASNYFVPRMYGFQINSSAYDWQHSQRQAALKAAGKSKKAKSLAVKK